MVGSFERFNLEEIRGSGWSFVECGCGLLGRTGSIRKVSLEAISIPGRKGEGGDKRKICGVKK